MGVVTFNGKSTTDYGLVVQFIPPYEFPEREYQTVDVPGRNGDLILDKGSYRNVERTYSFAKALESNKSFTEQANEIVSWLNSAKGYARLQDTYETDKNGDPLYYRMAFFKSEGSLSNFYDTATVIDVTFECKPQRWLLKGEKDIPVTSSPFDLPINPTQYDANPIITMTVAANTTATIEIGDCTVTVGKFTQSTTLTIDCENKECYSGNTLYNSKVSFSTGKFPVLPGSVATTVTVTNATNVKIQPRWWTL